MPSMLLPALLLPADSAAGLGEAKRQECNSMLFNISNVGSLALALQHGAVVHWV